MRSAGHDSDPLRTVRRDARAGNPRDGMNTATRPIPARRESKPKRPHPDKRLSAALVRSARPGRRAGGNGPYIDVQPSGARSWIQPLVIDGRRADFGLGSAVRVPLDAARVPRLSDEAATHAGRGVNRNRTGIGYDTHVAHARPAERRG